MFNQYLRYIYHPRLDPWIQIPGGWIYGKISSLCKGLPECHEVREKNDALAPDKTMGPCWQKWFWLAEKLVWMGFTVIGFNWFSCVLSGFFFLLKTKKFSKSLAIEVASLSGKIDRSHQETIVLPPEKHYGSLFFTETNPGKQAS